GGGDLLDEGAQVRGLRRELPGGLGVARDGGAFTGPEQLVPTGDEGLEQLGGPALLLLVAGDRHGPHLAAERGHRFVTGGGDGDRDHVPFQVGGVVVQACDVPGAVDHHGGVAGLELVDHIALPPVDDGAGG